MTQQSITNADLRKQQYNMDVLIKNIDDLSLKTILYTQKLTASFCIDYLLNDEYMTCVEDEYYFTMDKVLSYQTHLTEEQMIEYIKTKQKTE